MCVFYQKGMFFIKQGLFFIKQRKSIKNRTFFLRNQPAEWPHVGPQVVHNQPAGRPQAARRIKTPKFHQTNQDGKISPHIKNINISLKNKTPASMRASIQRLKNGWVFDFALSLATASWVSGTTLGEKIRDSGPLREHKYLLCFNHI